MELVELHVGNLSAGTVRHGDSVSGGHGGVRRVAVDLACSSAGQQHGARANRIQIVLTVEQPRAGHSVVFNDQIRGRRPFDNVIFWCSRACAKSDLPISAPVASPLACRMRFRLCAPSRVSMSLPCSRSKPVPQRNNSSTRSGPSSTSTSRRVAIDEAVSRGDGVLEVQRDIFIAAESDSDSPLRVVGIRLAEGFFCDDQYAASFRESDSGAQAGDSGAHDQKVGFCSYGHNV